MIQWCWLEQSVGVPEIGLPRDGVIGKLRYFPIFMCQKFYEMDKYVAEQYSFVALYHLSALNIAI